MEIKKYLRESWFFKKYDINKNDPVMEQVWKYQWNHKASIMIECGALYLILYYLF